MARVLGVSRSGYYKWRKRGPSKREIYNEKLKKEILEIYEENFKIYGSPKITVELKKRGYSCSRPRVARLMRKMGIKSKIMKTYKNTTDSDHDRPVAENLLDREFQVDEPDQAYVSDITYLPLYSSFSYLTVVMDLFNREPIGWSVSKNLEAKNTVIPALKMAMNRRNSKFDALFHSDRGKLSSMLQIYLV